MAPGRRRTPLALSIAVVGLLWLSACGRGDAGGAGPTGSFDGVDGPGEVVDDTTEGTSTAVPDDGGGDGETEEEDDATAQGVGDGDGVGGRVPAEVDEGEDPPPGPGGGGDAVVTGDDAEAVALAIWDEFLGRWEALRKGEIPREAVAEVAVFDEAVTQVVDASLEGDGARGTTSVELHGGTRSGITVDGSTVTFVDCVYEKALGSVPWVLAQRWDVTVVLDAGPGGAAAVTRLTQRATVTDDGEVVYDVCLNPVLESEVVATHIALREMFVETQEDPAAGIDDPRIDQLLMPSDAEDFNAALQDRIDEGTRVVNGAGTGLRVQLFAHGPGFAAAVSCENQVEGFGRVTVAGEYVATADADLQTLTTARYVFMGWRWLAENVQNSSDFVCPQDPVEAVNVAGDPSDRFTP